MEFHLVQNYQNPFNPSTTVKFTVEVFDILGRLVTTLFIGKAESAQFYSARFDAGGLASGVYFFRLQSGNRVDLKRMMLVK